VLAAAVIALLARAVAVYVVLGVLYPLRWRVSFRWQHLIVWSGLRGAVAVALALSLGDGGAQFERILSLVYGVTLASILVQGTTVAALARLLLGEAGSRPSAKPA
jgi:CPA1 family monovalent cation:H+ antiporter